MIGLALASLLTVSLQAAVFDHGFEQEEPHAGPPRGFSTYGRSLADRAVTDKVSASGENSACIVADFGTENWGVIMLKDFGEWDLTGSTLSVKVRASTSFAGKQPIIAFKLIDEDGTGYRTAPKDLGAVDTSWVTFSQPVSALVQDEEAGEVPGIDLSRIVQYGVILFDRQDNNKVIKFYIDDLKAE
jgi:hypothetical protein